MLALLRGNSKETRKGIGPKEHIHSIRAFPLKTQLVKISLKKKKKEKKERKTVNGTYGKF